MPASGWLRTHHAVGCGWRAPTDANCRWLLDKCFAAGLEVVVWCATQELRLPTFVCTLFDRHRNTSYPHRASGSGCHPYRRIALSRAITEALQSRLTHIVGGRDDLFWSRYRDLLRVDDGRVRRGVKLVLSEPEGISFDAIPEAPPMRSIAEMQGWVLAELSANGFRRRSPSISPKPRSASRSSTSACPVCRGRNQLGWVYPGSADAEDPGRDGSERRTCVVDRPYSLRQAGLGGHRSLWSGSNGIGVPGGRAGYPDRHHRMGCSATSLGLAQEILYAMSAGAEVAGAASVGALRAAELSPFGMIGIGSIYRPFAAGHWTDDDEVAVMHATEYLAFRR